MGIVGDFICILLNLARAHVWAVPVLGILGATTNLIGPKFGPPLSFNQYQPCQGVLHYSLLPQRAPPIMLQALAGLSGGLECMRYQCTCMPSRDVSCVTLTFRYFACNGALAHCRWGSDAGREHKWALDQQ